MLTAIVSSLEELGYVQHLLQCSEQINEFRARCWDDDQPSSESGVGPLAMARLIKIEAFLDNLVVVKENVLRKTAALVQELQ